jgi:hypothetical protein
MSNLNSQPKSLEKQSFLPRIINTSLILWMQENQTKDFSNLSQLSSLSEDQRVDVIYPMALNFIKTTKAEVLKNLSESRPSLSFIFTYTPNETELKERALKLAKYIASFI